MILLRRNRLIKKYFFEVSNISLNIALFMFIKYTDAIFSKIKINLSIKEILFFLISVALLSLIYITKTKADDIFLKKQYNGINMFVLDLFFIYTYL